MAAIIKETDSSSVERQLNLSPAHQAQKKAAEQQYYGLMNQMNNGPAGVLYSLADKLIQIYLQLQRIENVMNNDETIVQGTTITVGADEQRSDANWTFASAIAQAGGSAASFMITLGVTAGNIVKAKPINAEYGKAKTGLDTYTKMNDELQPPKVQDIKLSDDPIENGNGLSETARRMTNGVFEDEAGKPLTKEQMDDEIETMNRKQYDQFKAKLKDAIATKQSAVESASSNLQSMQQRLSFVKELGNSASQSISQGFQGKFASNAGQAKAGGQVANAVSGMAGSTANNAAQGIDQAQSKVGSALENAKAGSGSSVYQ